MSSRLKRRFALILLALLAFAQVNVALAGCFRDRASMMPASAANSDPGAPCDGCDVPVSKLADHISNACVVHCTSDLQLAGEPFVVVLSAADMPVLVLKPFESPPRANRALDGPPVAAPPRRILLHSFLI